MKWRCVFMTAGFVFLGVFLCAPAAPAQSPASDFSGSSMMVPWPDFKAVLDKLAAQPPDLEDPPPYDAVVGSADYVAAVGPEKVSVTAYVEIVVLKTKGWAKVSILDAGVPLMSAALDGKPTALVPGDDGRLNLILRDAGPHNLVLKVEIPVSADSGPEQFNLPAVSAQVNRIEVHIDKPDLVVMLSPGGPAESKTQGGKTLAVGSFPPTSNINVSWARRAPKAEKEEARVSAEVGTLLTVGEGLAVYSSIIDYDIKQKPRSEFRLLLPNDVSVADVSTEGIVDWKVNKTDQGQELSISISFEALGRHQVAITYEKILPAGDQTTLKSGDLTVMDVVRETGRLAVAVRTNVQVTAENLQNLAPIDVSELPPDLRGNADQSVLFGYKYIKHPSGLDLKVVRHADASVLACAVQNAKYRVMVTEDGKEIIEGTFQVANRSRQFLTLTLPPGTDLWGVFRDEEPVKAAEDGGKFLLPIYKGGLNETFSLRFIAYRKAGGFFLLGAKSYDLPKLDVGTNAVELDLYLPPRYRVGGFGGKLRPSAPKPMKTDDVSAVSGEFDMGITEGKKSGGLGGDERLDKNVQYRKSQIQANAQINLMPIAAENEAFSGTMARGALPVAVAIAWEGRRYHFAAQILEPGEASGLRLFYARHAQSGLLILLAFACAAWIGYLIAAYVLSTRRPQIPRPDKRRLVYGFAAAAVLALACVHSETGAGTISLGLLFGVLSMVLRYRRLVRKSKSAPPAQAPVPSPEGGAQ